jgi:uncharacterized cupin superfamily protein
MTTFAVPVAAVELRPLELDPEQVLEGTPQTSGAVLSTSPDGRVERGVWQITPGVVRDVEADELFVVISGRATIELEDGRVLEVGPGDAAVLREGERTVWRVHETLRKVYQVTSQR